MTMDMVPKHRGELTLAMLTEMTGYQPTELALITRTVAVDAPLGELAVFLHACRTLGLDPLLRQAYWIRRGKPPNTKGTLQVAIDGFRGLADRQGNYAGSSEPVFRGYLTVTDEFRGKVTVPEYCQVTTWKIVAGHKAAFTGEARWEEFYPGPGKVGEMWRKMPHHMLAKCAEAQSLRKGWPAILGSVALDADLGETGGVSVTELPTVAAPRTAPEGPQSAPRRTLTAADYDAIFGTDDTADGPPTKPQGPAEPEPPEQTDE